MVAPTGIMNPPMVLPDLAACYDRCNADGSCVAVDYSSLTGICTTYSPLGDDYYMVADPYSVLAIYEQGDCPLVPV